MTAKEKFLIKLIEFQQVVEDKERRSVLDMEMPKDYEAIEIQRKAILDHIFAPTGTLCPNCGEATIWHYDKHWKSDPTYCEQCGWKDPAHNLREVEIYDSI